MFIIFCRAALRDLIDVKVFLDTVSLSDFGTNFSNDAVPVLGVNVRWF